MVILIWQFGEFVFIRQIKCTHCLHSSATIRDLDSPSHQTKDPPIYITYQFAKLYVRQMYHVYDIGFCFAARFHKLLRFLCNYVQNFIVL